jgi:endonuclease/exonuclease/phosphatase family metal-dependent hydrolase
LLASKVPTYVAVQLSVLTYNTWLGPAFVARDAEHRAHRIPSVIAQTGAHVVALQEVWLPKYREALIAAFARHGYPHAASAQGTQGRIRGVYGNGLLIVSRLRIARQRLYEYRRYTSFDEFFVRKAALSVSIDMGEHGQLAVTNTHLGAVNFNKKTNAFVPLHRLRQLAQIDELCTFLDGASEPHVVLGDFNTHFCKWDATRSAFDEQIPDTHYRYLCSKLNLADAIVRDQNTHACNTFVRRNPYVAGNRFALGPDECNDYILFRGGHHVRCQKATLALTEPDGSSGKPLSDHYGVLATFQVGHPGNAPSG